MTPIRQRLRAETAAGHAALEAVMDLSPGALTIGNYGRALQVLHAVRAGWEPMLDRYFPGVPAQHLGRLAEDLAVLRLPALAPAPAPVVRSRAEAWGVRYVLEGSALGGRVILKDVAALGMTAESGARYFAGEGSDTGRRWTAFLAELDASAIEGGASGIIAGAKSAFEALGAFARKRSNDG